LQSDASPLRHVALPIPYHDRRPVKSGEALLRVRAFVYAAGQAPRILLGVFTLWICRPRDREGSVDLGGRL
jgi:hypothetical protein